MQSQQYLFKKCNAYVADFISRLVSETIKQVYVHPVRYELIWKDEVDVSELKYASDLFQQIFYDEEFDKDTYKEFIKKRARASQSQLLQWYKAELFDALTIDPPSDVLTLAMSIDWQWDTLLLPHTQLQARSLQTGNKDLRGGGCGHMGFTKADFFWQTGTPQGITLRDVTEAAYRMKGSKYDERFESFASMDLETIGENLLECTCDFSYQS
ncbi:hypothetical protein BKI52_38175 [marine bacterium AO1-C]|nr:hypothetical protein BKI52_38175 [marine bacterium AO1-C]